MPPSATALMRQLSLAADRATSLPIVMRDEWSPDRCPAQILPWLGWAFGVEEWDAAWTDTQKRAAIAASLELKRTKGTIGAVQDAVATMGLTAQVQEWFRDVPVRDPYTYRLILTVEQVGFDTEQFRRLLLLINRTKNVRSHLSQLAVQVNTRDTLYSGGATLLGLDITVNYSYEGDTPLQLDGSWQLDGSQTLDGIKN
jgi:phage tail P2-like protein